MSLIHHLQQVSDYRTKPLYPLWVVMLLVIMGIMSGCTGYRALESFVERHQSALLELLELPYKRLPSFTTLRRIMIRINFGSLTTAFNAWAAETFTVTEGEQLATDGKSIKASVRDYAQSYQDFISVVSAFSVSQGIVVGLQSMHNLATSEIATVQSLLEVLDVHGACFTMDALHTQKKLWSRSSIVEMTI
jgi:DDE_Tnp_1-associated